MNIKPSVATVTIECPLCLGEGELTRTEVLDRLGVKDFARVAQLSAEEAFRLLLQKQEHARQNDWARFEAELAKRTADLAQRHKDELHALTARTKELEAAAMPFDRLRAGSSQKNAKERGTHCVGNARKVKSLGHPAQVSPNDSASGDNRTESDQPRFVQARHRQVISSFA
jgi:hypothetical protein